MAEKSAVALDKLGTLETAENHLPAMSLESYTSYTYLGKKRKKHGTYGLDGGNEESYK